LDHDRRQDLDPPGKSGGRGGGSAISSGTGGGHRERGGASIASASAAVPARPAELDSEERADPAAPQRIRNLEFRAAEVGGTRQDRGNRFHLRIAIVPRTAAPFAM